MIERFSELPALIARELETPRRVVVALLDAFGWTFVQRHAAHPLLARIARDGTLAPVAAQFPSTTTAHVTTMHTGMPVEVHGLYEWRVWDPDVGKVITPLLTPHAGLLPDGPSFYQRLAVRCGAASTVYSPAAFSPSAYDALAVRGAKLVPYSDLAAIDLGETTEYTYIYYDTIDATGHRFGPSSAEFDAACTAALDALSQALATLPPSTTLLLTADHGQIDITPGAVDLLDLDGAGDPAGSARDLFLNLPVESVPALNAALGDRATAVPTTSLFPSAGPRLTARLPPVCVLPAPGRLTWLSTHATDPQLSFHGHHGGRTPEESTTFLGMLRTA